MTSKLIPTDPSKVQVIRSITPSIVTLSAPFNRFGRFKIGGRGTIVKLESGAIAVFSPVALTPQVQSELERLGNDVRYISALDFEHHIFISEWARAFPSAKLLGVEGLPEKREKDEATAGNEFEHIWTNKNKGDLKVDEEFDKEFDYEYLGSHANKELVFLHKPSKTLIEADLMFNLPATEQYSKSGENASSGLLTKFFIGFQNTHGDATWQKRFIWYVASSANRADFSQSVKKIAGWDFQRIIPCHGDVIEKDAKGVFRKVFDWYLNGLAK